MNYKLAAAAECKKMLILDKTSEMIKIKRDTIIKKGDILTDPENTEQWEVTDIDGFNFRAKNTKTSREGVLNKLDLVVSGWQMEIKDGRGYW